MVNEMTPEQIRAMHASQNNNGSPKLHSSIFNKFKNRGKLSEHGKNHLHKFADLTKKSAGKTKQKIQEKQHEKTAKLHQINWQVNQIRDSDDSDSEKIARLQRLLNNNHKDIDHPLLTRIQLEMKTLHGSNHQSNPHTDHAERLQQESRNNGNEPSVPFVNGFVGNPKKVVGYDHQTEQEIYDDDTRSEPEEPDYNQSGSNIADILNNERLQHQVK